MGPIPDPRYKSMLNRIGMDVVDVTPKIVFIADRVLPITPLPDATLPLGGTASRTGSPTARLRENVDLISRQRVAKSRSPSGIVQTAWR
jgi:hypothetical protein